MKLRQAPPYVLLRRHLTYNEHTGLFHHRVNSRRKPKGSLAGFIGNDGYWNIGLGGNHYAGHRLAWFYVHGEWQSEIDHKDRVRANNAIKNLRPASRAQNNMNSDGWGVKKKSELPRGVYLHSVDKSRYRAQIGVNYKIIHLGVFNTIEEAATAYALAARQYFGEFAA